ISQLLTEMDGLEALKNVILVAATNRPDIIDSALLRAGRFGRHIEVKMPDQDTREKILKIHLKSKPTTNDIDIRELAKELEGRTGADIAALCEEATIMSIREAIMMKGYSDDDVNIGEIKLTYKHFTEALKDIKKESERSRKSYMRQEGALPLYS
ncbi:MAG: AAA family ATPase, partial [archaeon]|nr:AAA family ATPase [archaeon]